MVKRHLWIVLMVDLFKRVENNIWGGYLNKTTMMRVKVGKQMVFIGANSWNTLGIG